MRMKSYIFLLIFFLAMRYLHAICPLCTVAIGAGVGFSRWFGVPDSIAGIWIGGFLMALSLWAIMALRKTRYIFFGYQLIVPVAIYASTLVPLWFYGFFANSGYCLGLDSFMLAIMLGSVSFIIGIVLHCWLKLYHNNRSFFPFQKVVIPLVVLLIISIIVYLVIYKGGP